MPRVRLSLSRDNSGPLQVATAGHRDSPRYHERHADIAFAGYRRIDAVLRYVRATTATWKSTTRHYTEHRAAQGSDSRECRSTSASAILAQRCARRSGAEF